MTCMYRILLVIFCTLGGFQIATAGEFYFGQALGTNHCIADQKADCDQISIACWTMRVGSSCRLF